MAFGGLCQTDPRCLYVGQRLMRYSGRGYRRYVKRQLHRALRRENELMIAEFVVGDTPTWDELWLEVDACAD